MRFEELKNISGTVEIMVDEKASDMEELDPAFFSSTKTTEHVSRIWMYLQKDLDMRDT